VNVQRFSRAADSYWRLRSALEDYDSPVCDIKRPKGMQTRDFDRRIALLTKCESVMMRDILNIKTKPL
jgi:hypothetical protein